MSYEQRPYNNDTNGGYYNGNGEAYPPGWGVPPQPYWPPEYAQNPQQPYVWPNQAMNSPAPQQDYGNAQYGAWPAPPAYPPPPPQQPPPQQPPQQQYQGWWPSAQQEYAYAQPRPAHEYNLNYDDDDEIPLPVLPPLEVKESELPPEKPEKSPRLSPAARKVLQVIWDVVVAVFCVTIVMGAVLFALSYDPQKDFLGYRGYAAVDDTMRPHDGDAVSRGPGAKGSFSKGAMVIVKNVPAQQIQRGDIIAFTPEGGAGGDYLIHRVEKVLEAYGDEPGPWFVTKGDAGSTEDAPIAASQYTGKKVLHIPAAGAAILLVREHLALSIAIFACCFGCIFVLRWLLAKPEPKPKKKALPSADQKRQYA